MWCHFNLCVTVFFAHVFLYTFVSSSNFKAIIPCTDDVDCSEFDNGTCSGGACKCSNSHLCETKQVKVVTKIGEKCNETEECNIENSECRKSKCLCKEGYVKSTDGRKCLTVSNGIPGSCEDSVQCYTKSPDSVCINNECVCDGMHEFGGKCYKNVDSYTRCRVDTDCLKMSNNSFCYNNDADVIGICKCRDGYEMVSRNRTFFACLGPAGYGEECEKNMQCQLLLTENAECFESSCRCKDGSHLYSDGRCYVSVLLEDFCRSDGNCWMKSGIFGNCVSGRCSCRFDKEVPTADRTNCIEGKKLGELCDSDSQCALIPNAQCRVNCRCAPGYVLSRDQANCLRAATRFFDPCVENDQCSQYLESSVCVSNNCTCADGFHGYGSRCVRTVALGGSCISLEECIPESKYSDTIACNNGQCQCLPGAVNEFLGCNKCASIQVNYAVVISLMFVLFKFL